MKNIALLVLKIIYSQGDEYYQSENDTHYIASFSNDYPMQHGKGWELRVNKTTFEIVTSKKIRKTYKNKFEQLDLLLPMMKSLIESSKSYSRADIIHAFTSGHNKAKIGMTHSNALLQYKEEQKL